MLSSCLWRSYVRVVAVVVIVYYYSFHSFSSGCHFCLLHRHEHAHTHTQPHTQPHPHIERNVYLLKILNTTNWKLYKSECYSSFSFACWFLCTHTCTNQLILDSMYTTLNTLTHFFHFGSGMRVSRHNHIQNTNTTLKRTSTCEHCIRKRKTITISHHTRAHTKTNESKEMKNNEKKWKRFKSFVFTKLHKKKLFFFFWIL